MCYSLKIFFVVLLLSFLTITEAQKSAVYNVESKFGWDEVLTLQNEFITLSTVPATGRTLEFNLNDHPFLWKNTQMFGKVFSQNDSITAAQWRNYGGHRITLLPRLYTKNPEGEWLKRWPPPAIIESSPYSFSQNKSLSGYKGFSITSGEQVLPSPFSIKNSFYQAPEEERLVYSRSMQIEDGSSKVYINHVLKNAGDKPVERGMLAVCQHISNHGNRDGQNFWAYFPVDSAYLMPDNSIADISMKPERLWELAKKKLKLTEADTVMKSHYYTQGKHYRGIIVPGNIIGG